jgi:uncharacterized RDD family membrane protein YckC
MSNDFNPYAAPNQFGAPSATSGRQKPLADLGKRFLGAVVDGLAGVVFVLPGYGMAIAAGVSAGPGAEPPALAFVGIGLALVGALALLGVQIYLLATRSQTIGKYVMKTQIIDINTGQPAGLLNTLVLRIIVNGIIGAIPCVGAIYAIVDICFIFREDRRCIHDLIASTVVVDIS